jgi:hypothetical protein
MLDFCNCLSDFGFPSVFGLRASDLGESSPTIEHVCRRRLPRLFRVFASLLFNPLPIWRDIPLPSPHYPPEDPSWQS